MLARFGRLVELQARSIVSETLDAMKELLVARRALVKDRAAALNRTARRCSNASPPHGFARSSASLPPSTLPCG